MARRCIDIELGGNLINSSILTNLDDLPLNVRSGYELFDQRAIPPFISSYGYVVGDVNLQNYEYYSSDNIIRLKGERNGDDGAVIFTLYNNGGEYFTFTYFSLNVVYYTPTAWACWVIDDDEQLGWVVRIVKIPSFLGDEYIVFCYGGDNTTYNALHGAIPVTYQWSSVPAISGKNGILSLSMIKPPVEGTSTGTANDFSRLVSASDIRRLMENAPNNEDYEIIWAGQTKWLTIQRTAPLTIFIIKLWSFGYSDPVYTYTYNPGSSPNLYLSFLRDMENQKAGIAIIRTDRPNVDLVYSYATPDTFMTDEEMTTVYNWLLGHVTNDTDGIDSFEKTDGDGGGDLINRNTENIPKPGAPGKSAYATGFITQWLVTNTQAQALSAFLWTDNFVENFKKFFNDPRQIIVALQIFPLTPDHASEPREIKAGGISTGVNGYKVSHQFKNYPMGSVTIEKRLSNGVYFDYAPFTDVKIYLPYCGEHSLDVNDVMGKKLDLSYTVDHLTGACVAHLVTSDPYTEGSNENTCHYNFSGQMGIQIPISSEDFTRVYSGFISAGAVIGGAIATGLTGGMTAPLAIGSIANSAQNVMNMSPQVTYNSGGGSLTGALSGKCPYITISEPEIFESENQRSLIGYPSYLTRSLSQCNGFTKVLDIHLDNLSCTEYEREQIRNVLLSGVIIQNGTTISAEYLEPNVPGNYIFLFLKNMSDKNTIGKTFAGENNEIDCVKYEGRLLENQSIEKPVLIVNGDITSYNYVYVPCFNRFYYINDITIKTGELKFVTCDVDALQTYKDDLMNLSGIIESQEQLDNASLLMNNSSYWCQQNKRIVTIRFKTDGNPTEFNTSMEQYLLTIAGSE